MSQVATAPAQFTPDSGIRLTNEAVDHLRRQIEREPGAIGFRLGVKKSGCSGYMYTTEWVLEAAADDEIFRFGDINVHVHRPDLLLVNGTEIDLVQQGLNRSLVFRNPNAAGECGCGESFAVNQPSNGGL